MAKFKRKLIKERMKADISKVRAKGKRRGRKPLPTMVVKKIIDAYKSAPDSSARDVAQLVCVSPASVNRIRKGYLAGIYDQDGFRYEKPLVSV